MVFTPLIRNSAANSDYAGQPKLRYLHALPLLTKLTSGKGRRSADRDLEAQVVMLTDSLQLRQQLAAERNGLFTGAEEVTSREIFNRTNRAIHFWVPWTIKPLVSYF